MVDKALKQIEINYEIHRKSRCFASGSKERNSILSVFQHPLILWPWYRKNTVWSQGAHFQLFGISVALRINAPRKGVWQ
jgi:hypothetical protein